MTISNQQLIAALSSFIRDEQQSANQQLLELWKRPLAEKLEKGLSQGFTMLTRGDELSTLWAYLGNNESRFREGDLLTIHGGDPITSPLGKGFSLEMEEDERWLLRSTRAESLFSDYTGGSCYADQDTIDLTSYYEQSLKEISDSPIGLEILLPLLKGVLDISFDERDRSDAERIALAEGFNPQQAEAVGLAFGAEQVACIQGPPGTGKTRVLALIARLMIERGERVFITSHTHTAINNALNKINAEGVPTVKIGRDIQRKGLDASIDCYPGLGDWQDRPTNGYVVGATPFATCTSRLEGYEFDTVIFDEASQITVPLALMAMRKGKRYIFIGDQKQLPPVMLSRSVLDKKSLSVFSALTDQDADHNVMLSETYRMNQWLTAWPSRTYYDSKLVATGKNSQRQLLLAEVPERFKPVFDPSESGIFIPTLDYSARTHNRQDAKLVADLCETALNGGLALENIGIVTPYRAQGRAIRKHLIHRFGRAQASKVVADTVERMQGQERELVILSLATGNEAFLGIIAPFFFQPERLNVSMTRSMSKLIVIGPEVSKELTLEDEIIHQWVNQYVDLVKHLKKVEL